MSKSERAKMRNLRFGVASAVFGLLAVGALTIAAPAKAETTVTMAQGIDPEGLDPAYETLVSSRSIFTNIYDTLVWRDAKGKLLPSLAESWKWLDETSLQLNLRKGVKFHNGDSFTADDLIWTANRYMDKKDRKPLYSYVKGLYKTIEKKDDYTVVMHLAKPNAMQFGDFARMPVLPKKAFMAMGKEKFASNPIGTGPFKFERWDRNEQLVLTAFDGHWRGRASVDKYVIKPIPEDFARFAALKTGAVDIIINLPPERVAELEKDARLKVGRVPSARGIHYAFNINIKPYSDVRVRQAINHAVDVQEIIDTVLGGMAYANPAFCAKALFGHDPMVAPFKHDMAKAKKLLAEAGYPNGFKTKLLTPTGRYMKDREVSLAIAGQLAKVGIEVDVVAPEWADFLDQLYGRGKHGTKRIEDAFQGIYMLGTGGPTLDCGRTLNQRAMWNGGRMKYYHTDRSDKLDAMIAEQKATLDVGKREEMFKKIQAFIRQDVPWIFLYDQEDLYGLTKRIQWQPRPDEFVWIYDVKVKE
jgi:peptide/nickel transport system substrate-binding protein